MAFPKPFYRWRPHPWHGLEVGADAPRVVEAYIEITPFDMVKYEVDKETGYLKVDRPQTRIEFHPPVVVRIHPADVLRSDAWSRPCATTSISRRRRPARRLRGVRTGRSNRSEIVLCACGSSEDSR